MEERGVTVRHPDGTTTCHRGQGTPKYAVVIGPVVDTQAHITYLELLAQSDDHAAEAYLEAARSPQVDFINRRGRMVPALLVPARNQHIAAIQEHPILEVLESRAREFAQVCRASAERHRNEIATLRAGTQEPIGGYDVYDWYETRGQAVTAVEALSHLTEIGIQVSVESVSGDQHPGERPSYTPLVAASRPGSTTTIPTAT